MAANYAVVTNYITTLSAPMTSSQLTIPVNSVTTKDGHVLTMADLGAEVYFTLEPGTVSEEIIKCTSISGLNWVVSATGRGMLYYGASDINSSSNAKAHVAGAIVIMSNVKNVYERLVDKEGDETIGGIKTFSSLPVIPITPLAPTDASSKNYVDIATGAAGGITAFLVVQNGALTVDVGSGEWMFNDTPTLFAGATAQAVVAASTNFVELLPGNTISVNQTAFTPGSLPLGIVTTSGVAITSIVDRRVWLTNASQQQPITAIFTYGGTIAVGDPLYLDSADGKAKKALATGAATADSFIGIALDAGVNNDTGKRVQTNGTVTVVAGLTPGFLYLSDTGTLSASPGTYRKFIGFAGTATKFVLMPMNSPVELAGANTDTTTANFNEAMTFFANTDITGAEAETLTNGSAADALHQHTIAIIQNTRAIDAVSGAVTYAHGLSVTPKYIEIVTIGSDVTSDTAFTGAWGFSNGLVNMCTQIEETNAGANNLFNPSNNATACVDCTIPNGAAANDRQTAVATFNGTNIILTWTRTTNGAGATGTLFFTILVHAS